MSRSPRPTRVTLAAAALTALGLTVSGCTGATTGAGTDGSAADGDATSAGAEGQAAPEPQAVISANLPESGSVPVSRFVKLSVQDGSLDRVAVRAKGVKGAKGLVSGAMTDDGASWRADERLEAGTTYVMRAKATDHQGLVTTQKRRFSADDLALSEQTYASIAPLDGSTVGVGMPVIVKYDIPVQRKKAFEKRMNVENSSNQAGAWHWLSDYEAHWRPKTYWKPGTTVDVSVDVNSLPAGNGIYGQMDREASFTVGDRRIMKVDLATKQLTYVVNGTVEATMPFSGGKPGFETRSGTKVIIEKFREKRMDAATTGISEDDPEYYNIEDVEYAMRLTYTGEFIHAAPWSVGSQGYSNVSHGCTGLSTENAGYLYDNTIIGDVVETTGSSRQMTLTNGYGDWNVSFKEWKQGSALAG
ncbi:L,D-transpeptidase family protein [Nocardioidaceae bacterium]|nr:L,D-transpeptidase family protein [Nocardioidaceae bacterium]